MSDVASLELCKELYELSGWGDPDKGVPIAESENAWTSHHYCQEQASDEWEIYESPYEHTIHGYQHWCPAYDLGYLLRKLPVSIPYETENHIRNKSLKVWKHEHGFSAGYAGFKSINADTPEDAAAKLAIELLKQGILPTNKDKETNDD